MRSSFPLVCALVVAAGLTLAAPAGAAPISRAEAARLGAERGPVVREALAPAAAAAGVNDAAGKVLAYAPRVSVFGGRRDGAFGAGLELGGTVSQDLSLHGLGAARGRVAEAFTRSSRGGVERARLEGGSAALLAWLGVLEAQQLVALRITSRSEALELARVADARVARGVAMPSEAALAASEVGAAQLAEQDAEGRLVEARAALAFTLGIPPAPELVATGALDADTTIELPLRHDHPAATEARAQIVRAEAEAKLARAQASPPLTLGVNYAREGNGEQFLTGTIAFPLPILDPTRFEGALQRANVLSAQARANRVAAEIERDQALATHDREHTREVRDTLRTRVTVPLREALRLAWAGYQAGTQDATGLLVMRQRLIGAEEQLVHAFAEVQRADVRSALARGTLLDEAGR